MKGWLSKLVAGQVVPYATMIAGIVAVTLALLLYVQTRRVEAGTVQTAQCAAALTDEQQTVASQTKALAGWKAVADGADEARIRAEAQAAREAEEAAILQARIQGLLNKDSALPACQALLDTRLDLLCPGTAEAIRLEAAR